MLSKSAWNMPRSPRRIRKSRKPTARTAWTASDNISTSRGLCVRRAETLDADLVELDRRTGWSRIRLVAKGRASVAIACFIGNFCQLKMISAGRHRQVGTQAKLAPVRIREDEGARADVFAGTVEKNVRRLQDVRLNEFCNPTASNCCSRTAFCASRALRWALDLPDI